MVLFSNMKSANQVFDQMFPRNLLGLIVHGLYLLHDNVHSIECIRYELINMLIGTRKCGVQPLYLTGTR